MPVNPQEVQALAEDLIPDETMGAVALRAVVTEAIQRWEARERSERKQTFLPTSDPELERINTAHDLEAFRAARGLRTDWHEPDNNGVSAYVMGDHLDNAMGPSVDHSWGELNVVLVQETPWRPEQGQPIFQPIAVVNLATLLGWATDGARTETALAEAQAQR